MKLLQLLLLSIFIISCRGEGADDVQKIDQILQIYIKNSEGTDLLNKESSGAFFSVELKDLGALQDRVSVSSNLRTDESRTKFLEYIAGATRTLQSNSADTHQIYKSDIAIQYKETENAAIVEDRIEIFYSRTSAVFQISSVVYNDVTVFKKVEGQPNIITIVK